MKDTFIMDKSRVFRKKKKRIKVIFEKLDFFSRISLNFLNLLTVARDIEICETRDILPTLIRMPVDPRVTRIARLLEKFTSRTIERILARLESSSWKREKM